MEGLVLVSCMPTLSDRASGERSVVETIIQGRRLYDRVSAHVTSGVIAHQNFRLEGFDVFNVSLW